MSAFDDWLRDIVAKQPGIYLGEIQAALRAECSVQMAESTLSTACQILNGLKKATLIVAEQKQIRSLILHLNDHDLDFREFSERLNRFPGLNRYIVALANYYVTGADRRIESSAHAAALLGIRGLQNYFEPLTDDDRPRAATG